MTKHRPLTMVRFEARLEVADDSVVDGENWLQLNLPDGKAAWMFGGDAARWWNWANSFWGFCTCGAAGRRLDSIVRDLRRCWNGSAGSRSRAMLACRLHGTALRAGDLLYFGSADGKVDPMGMYLGSGEFINATRHLKPVVQICKLSDPHWSRAFVTARRVK